MISHFPTPHNDELFYSLCARYGSRVAYPNNKFLLLDLFDSPTASAVVDIPDRLRFFTEALPTGTSLTVDRLIDRYTLFPFFSAFLPPDRVNQIRKDMQVSSGPAAHMRSGVMGSSIPMPDYLRFCPLCVQEDEESSGQTYWHRLHQLPGIEVCHLHQVYLENSSVGLRAGRKLLQFISAEQAARTVPVRRIDSSNPDHQTLLNLARDASWLLEHPSPGTSLKVLHNRYLQLLIKQGLATYTGSIHVQSFIEQDDLANKFSLNFDVSIVDMELKDRLFEWVKQDVTGSFCGVANGKKILGDLLARCDLNRKEDTASFLDEMVDHLTTDVRSKDNNEVKIDSLMRKGKSVESLYDYIFSLEFLKPHYVLKMGDKEMFQLSPGEKGALLLVFYLLVDKGDIPLVIDQPEENLDNQTIFDLLVPSIKRAKKRRQIIIVTHNPNIAVVCDAEQFIYSTIDKKNQQRVEYKSGSIESMEINKNALNVLEGTRPAFDNRSSKYLPDQH